jgi:6-phosphogluconolactonase
MASAVERELIVTDNIAEEAVRCFLTAEPHTVALSGGGTPRATYERLATVEFRWGETDVFFSDERCVPPDHPDSNYKLAYDALLSKVDARVHRMPGESCDAAAYERELDATFGVGEAWPRFDFMLLGIGADGHTASLFPGDPALEERERRVVQVTRPDHSRLTLTLPILSASRLAVFLVEGESKREALAKLMAGADIPAARVEADRVIVIADPLAAGRS